MRNPTPASGKNPGLSLVGKIVLAFASIVLLFAGTGGYLWFALQRTHASSMVLGNKTLPAILSAQVIVKDGRRRYDGGGSGGLRG
jgi:hypothetical protein